jgi:hypothetical protein
MSEKVKKAKAIPRARLNVVLPPIYKKAIDLIYDTDRVKGSHQVELGLRLYMEKYRELLISNGIDIWSKTILVED